MGQRGSKVGFGRFVLLLVGAIALGVPTFAPTGDAMAQERPRTLMEFLFGGQRNDAGRPETRQAPRASRPKATRRASSPPASQPSPAAQPAVPEVAKAEDARVVLVVGDFLAGGAAEGLETAFAENAEVRIVDRSNGSSGLVRDDFYDWPGEIGAILEAEKPAAVVVMLGSNDRQQMTVDGSRENVRSDKWNAAYEERARRLAGAMAERNIPFVWLGLPAFKFSNMSSDMLAFNETQREVAEAAGGVFVDIWEGFVDENGAFSVTGPDVNGQPVRLRAGDGINFTQAGRRKIAFYAEKPLNRILDTGEGGGLPGGAGLGVSAPGTGPAGPVDRTPPVSLFDPGLDGGSELLGLVPPGRDEAANPAEKLAIQGVAPEPMPGRVDDFAGRRLPQSQPRPNGIEQPDRDRETTSATSP